MEKVIFASLTFVSTVQKCFRNNAYIIWYQYILSVKWNKCKPIGYLKSTTTQSDYH